MFGGHHYKNEQQDLSVQTVRTGNLELDGVDSTLLISLKKKK